MHQYCLRKSTKISNNRGVILALVIVVLFVIILVMVFAFNIWTLMARRQDSQAITNSIALEAASLLNSNDCIGRTNNLVALSRELVFDSRAIHNFTCNAYYDIFEPMARQVLDQSKHGAWVLEIGRQQIIASRLKELCTMLKSNPDLGAHGARVVDLEVGYVLDDLQSNAYDDSSDELQEFDLSRGWIDKKTRRFKGNINAKLPDDDADEIFKLSPLHTLSRGTVQQARLVNAGDFVKTAKLIDEEKLNLKVYCDQMPCAVKLKVAFPIEQNQSLENAVINRPDIIVQATAVTCGAQLAP